MIKTLEDAKIQYGAKNDRIYLMKLGKASASRVINELELLAEENDFGKIIAKVPIACEKEFAASGYQREGCVPGFYAGTEDGVFLARYRKSERRELENRQELDDVLALAKGRMQSPGSVELAEDFEFHYGRPRHAEMISNLYRQVFATYPFPIHDPEYIKETMRDNVLYFSIWQGGKMVALSSAEMDKQSRNAEMTDFATLPDWRGQGLGLYLLKRMEQDMRRLGIVTAYTIARSVSPGMNITFAKNGYEYGGRLINNTQISGRLESMNIWYKTLS